MNKTKKGKAKKIILTVLAVIIAVIVIISGAMAIINSKLKKENLELINTFKAVSYENQLIPKKDGDGVWTFNCDRDLKIMQLTDVHIGGGFLSADEDKKALNAVASMITAEKPDLVVITGDLAFPVPFIAGTFNNLTSANMVASLMENLGVYWIPLFGNHDTEAYSFYSRKDISEFYGGDNFKYCLFESGSEDVDGYGNSVINIKNADGIITQSLFMFDSHSYIKSDYFGVLGKYDSIHDSQIEWYKENVNKYSDYNKNRIAYLTETDTDNKFNVEELTEKYGTVKSLAFYHIPSREYLSLWNEFVDAGYKDTENIKYYYGTLGESDRLVYCGENDDSFFETLLEYNSTKGVFCGHDHLNNFSMEYKGIRLTYGYSIDYLAYSGIDTIGSQRGCTVITVRPDSTFDCYGENYYQEKYQSPVGIPKEDVTMQDFDIPDAE